MLTAEAYVIHTASCDSLLTLPIMSDRIRTTISLTPEAYEIFKRMADATNTSVSRTMGDWLTDTADAATLITIKMEEAKRAPMKVMRELRSMVAGMGNEVDTIMTDIRSKARAEGVSPGVTRASGARSAVPASLSSPPSSNTGGKSTNSAKTTTPKRKAA